MLTVQLTTTVSCILKDYEICKTTKQWFLIISSCCLSTWVPGNPHIKVFSSCEDVVVVVHNHTIKIKQTSEAPSQSALSWKKKQVEPKLCRLSRAELMPQGKGSGGFQQNSSEGVQPSSSTSEQHHHPTVI